MNERRKFTRISFANTVNLTFHDTHWSTNLLDISFKGALVETPKQWQQTIGDTGTLELVLTTEGEKNIKMQVCIAHQQNQQTGLSCTRIGVDSMSHLRRLVEVNLGDEHLLERELSMLISWNN